MADPSIGSHPSLAEALLEAAPDAIVIVGQDGRIVRVNGRTEVIFGYRREELIGELIEILVPERFRSRHTGERAGYSSHPRVRPMGTGPELLGRRKDGSEFPAEISLTTVQTESGPLVSSIIRDVTERHRLTEAQLRLGAIVDSSDEAIISKSLDGVITSWNRGAERMFGYSAAEVLGKPVAILFPPGREAEEQMILERVRRGESVMQLETVRRCKDGRDIEVSVTVSPLKSGTGRIVGASKVVRDITAQLRTQRAIVEANQMKSAFLANMSHELRTPLNAIIGFTELMYKGKVGPVSPDHREYLGDILTSSRHLLQLINDVLDLAKVESGKMEFRPEPVDMTTLVSEVRDVLRGLAATKRLHVQSAVDAALGPVTADPARLKQVLYNYLSNAIKFTPEGGTITIRVAPEGSDFFRLEVEDTGVGIAPQDLSRLFVEFQQLDAGTAKQYPGTGLGLALTKRIVEAHGGTVEVRSTLGQGSVFAAVIPRQPRSPGRSNGG
jgi:PAS domain S-box-containing protein